MLTLTNVQIMYDRAIEAVRDVSLTVDGGRIVALLGVERRRQVDAFGRRFPTSSTRKRAKFCTVRSRWMAGIF